MACCPAGAHSRWRALAGGTGALATAAAALDVGAVTLAGVVLALGPDGFRSVYAFAHRWVFGFQAVRAPARFGVLLAFGVAAAAGFAVTWWRRELRPAWHPVVLGLSAIVAVESLAWRVPYVPAPTSTHLSAHGYAMPRDQVRSRSCRSPRIAARPR